MRNVLPGMAADEQADGLDEEEVAIVMEIVEVIERGRKDKLPALRNVPKKKSLYNFEMNLMPILLYYICQVVAT